MQSDGKNELNIKSRTDKAFGNVEKIKNTLIERPYGKYSFKAALLMREALLIGGLLSNSESWTNITESNILKLTQPDTMLHRALLSTTGNPSRVFMCLELGVIPVRYAIMKKRLNFLHYILNESMTSIVRQVYDTLKVDSRKGDFFNLVQKDLKECNIKMTEEEIRAYSKRTWKIFITQTVKEKAFSDLTEENLNLEHTKNIVFEELKLSNYLKDNRKSLLSKIIFSVRSGTIDLKTVQPWKYFDNLCVMCEKKSETIEHFMTCKAYKNITPGYDWKLILDDYPDKQFEIAENIKRRQIQRKQKIEKYEAGHPQDIF